MSIYVNMMMVMNMISMISIMKKIINMYQRAVRGRYVIIEHSHPTLRQTVQEMEAVKGTVRTKCL